MNRKILGFALSLLTALTVVGAYPRSAHAQNASSAPVIAEFDVESDDRLVGGSQLRFTIEGTAKATASVRISGIKNRIPLKEVEEGVYEGTYTVKAGDRFTTATAARATLKRRNRSTSAVLQESLGVTDGVVAGGPAIQSFTVTPIEQIEPGADLDFVLTGTPGGKAAVSIEGLAGSLALREVKSGRYEGSYTIRRVDKIPVNARAAGTLVVGGQTLRTTATQALTLVARRPLLRNLYPREGETVAPGTSVSGAFDNSGVDVDPKSLRLVVAGRDVTSSTEIANQQFNYRGNLQPGPYTAVVTARDLAGYTVSQTWNFKVAGQATALPLEILSPQNNTEIANGRADIRGRTSPDATVDLAAVGVSPIWGMFGYSQKQPGQSTRADNNGNFAFAFQPQTVGKGTRYDITLTTQKNGLSQAANLVLVQKQ